MLAKGEWHDEPELPVFLRFDPGGEIWGTIEPPDVFRPELVALASGSLLVLGDNEGGGRVERYNAKTGKWREPAQMRTGRTRAQVTLLQDGRVLVAGGVELLSEPVDGGYSVTEGAALNSTEIYDPAADAWTSGPRLLRARQGGQAITLGDGSVLVFGGYVATPPEPANPDTGTPGPCPTPAGEYRAPVRRSDGMSDRSTRSKRWLDLVAAHRATMARPTGLGHAGTHSEFRSSRWQEPMIGASLIGTAERPSSD